VPLYRRIRIKEAGSAFTIPVLAEITLSKNKFNAALIPYITIFL
jgi:hypothetical protein